MTFAVVAAVSGGLQCQTLQTGPEETALPGFQSQVPEGCPWWPSEELFLLSGWHGTPTVDVEADCSQSNILLAELPRLWNDRQHQRKNNVLRRNASTFLKQKNYSWQASCCNACTNITWKFYLPQLTTLLSSTLHNRYVKGGHCYARATPLVNPRPRQSLQWPHDGGARGTTTSRDGYSNNLTKNIVLYS